MEKSCQDLKKHAVKSLIMKKRNEIINKYKNMIHVLFKKVQY